VIVSHAYFYWQQYKDKKEIRKQERLNQIKWMQFYTRFISHYISQWYS
jgi:C4-dicarboxylate transporter